MSSQNAALPRLRRAIDHAAHLLPAQGPIAIFIHHNTLHALEDLPFEQAVARGAAVFGCQPYLTEERFRGILARGRIRTDDLRAVMRDDLGGSVEERVLGFGSRLDLRLGMLQYPVRSGSAAELRWFVAETDALRKVRPDVSAAVRDRLIAGVLQMQAQPDGRTGIGKPQGLTRHLAAREAFGKLGPADIGQGEGGRGVFENRKIGGQGHGFAVHLRDIEHRVRGPNLATQQQPEAHPECYIVYSCLCNTDEGYSLFYSKHSALGDSASQIVTVVPSPGALWTSIRPPCKSIISLTMHSPSPVPGILPEVSAR